MTLSSHLWCFVRNPCFYKLQEAFKNPGRICRQLWKEKKRWLRT